ncbi:DUF1800 domain-containing protein [Sulfitobacter sp. SK012]|uniref:DUF1800 domain-containing protein n=1 Tax=Sulfitobacter sp. SK012 TaxID=1389005 RepID=UPI000E0C23D4|nr:DUF1800 domain-containing protein [Sulfitobacter sp. SK012]AXI48166.1 DUF1800 domain-containing protein [Sulfitobacter sp. SK012]
MTFSPEFAERRFGYGLSPLNPPVASTAAMLAGITAADVQAENFPIEGFETFRNRMILATSKRKELKKARKAGAKDDVQRLTKERKVINRAARQDSRRWMLASMLRRAHTQQAFFERLVAFWGDHFSAQGKAGVLRRGTAPFIETVMRPHVGGRFADLLIAAVTHPLMVHYLDQERSMGPQSNRALKIGRKAGLNENLAREVIELHTLGVSGPYTQDDVRQLAELFTGMSFQVEHGFKFRKDFVEPGTETVLGKTYGPKPSIGVIHSVLEDLARHPATARHIAQKLAVHFVSDMPDPLLVAHLEAAYLENDGALMPVYAALLEHPAAWQETALNMRPADEFIGAAFRALGMTSGAVDGLVEKDIIDLFYKPMALMGQTYQKPDGPDGWPEEDNAWVTPQGIAARMEWAMQVPLRLMPELPDPRDFVVTALGALAPPEVVFAAGAAESRHEAIGLVLCAPAFQRR